MAFGNVTAATEYATAKTDTWALGVRGSLPQWSQYDRTTTTSYDQLDRKTSETRTVEWSATDGGKLSGTSVTTSWGYDAQGHVTRVTDSLGNSTYNSYDALGQLRAVIEPARSSTVDGAAITPLTEYSYDAYGAADVVSRRSNNPKGVGEFKGAWTSSSHGYIIVGSSGDHIVRTLYDAGGHATQVDDPMAASTSYHNTFSVYTVYGQLARVWHDDAGSDGVSYVIYTSYAYDAAGHLLHSYAPSTDTSQSAHEVSTDYHYNAFGEVDKKGLKGGWQEFYDYNNNGQLWRTNSGDGVVHAYLHDLRGNVTADITSAGYGHGDADLSTAASESAADALAGTKRSASVFDLASHAIRLASPGRDVVDGGVTVRAGTTSWLVASTHDSVTFTFPDISKLGQGDVKLTITYVDTSNKTQHATVYADAYLVQGRYTWACSDVASISSVTISKRTYATYWSDISTTSSSQTSLVRTQLEIDAPDDPTAKVSFSYTPSNTNVPPTLVYFGDAYWFDATALTAGTTYNYTVTVTARDGTVTQRSGTFKPGSSQAAVPLDAVVVPTVQQTFDRWGNVLTRTDPRSTAWVTSYTYDSNNHVRSVEQPSLVANQDGPVTRFSYDALGRQIAVTDANGYLSGELYDAAGRVVETDQHPDGLTLVKTVNRYDVFGRLVQTISGNGFNADGTASDGIDDYTTQISYDALDHVLSVQHGVGGGDVQIFATSGLGATLSPMSLFKGAKQNLLETYTYDADGNRLSSWDGTRSSHDASVHVFTTYKYDAAGRLIETDEPLVTGQAVAAKISYVYDDYGHLKSQTDGDNRTATWQYDYFGKKLVAHKDYGGHTYADSYDHAGQLYRQTSSGGQDLNYTFDAAGQVTQVWDAAVHETTTYAYDLAGRHLLERTAVDGHAFQDNHLGYDALGRLVSSSDESADVTFGYDAVGNRTSVTTWVNMDGARAFNGQEAPGPLVLHIFTFDGMNRMLHDDWQTSDTQGTNGHTLTYDRDSNRLTDTFYGNKVTITNAPAITGYDNCGNPIYGPGTPTCVATGGQLVTESYTYDADDRLQKTFYDGIQIDSRVYDGAGRAVMEGIDGALISGYADAVNQGLDSAHAIDFGTRVNQYDERGELVAERVMQASALNDYVTDYTPTFTGGKQVQGYDLQGNLLGSTMTNYRGTSYTVTNRITAFHIAEGYQQATQTSVNSLTSTTTSAVTTTYNANDLIATVTDQVDPTANRAYIDDAQGHVLDNQATTAGHDLRNLIVAGEVLGAYGVGIDPNAPHDVQGNANYVQLIQFNLGYKSLNDSSVAAGVGSYTVQQGDTLEAIAAGAYADSALWLNVARANGLSGNTDVRVGQTLVLPNLGAGVHNNLQTPERYNPAVIIGPRTPTLPLPTAANDESNAHPMAMMMMAADGDTSSWSEPSFDWTDELDLSADGSDANYYGAGSDYTYSSGSNGGFSSSGGSAIDISVNIDLGSFSYGASSGATDAGETSSSYNMYANLGWTQGAGGQYQAPDAGSGSAGGSTTDTGEATGSYNIYDNLGWSQGTAAQASGSSSGSGGATDAGDSSGSYNMYANLGWTQDAGGQYQAPDSGSSSAGTGAALGSGGSSTDAGGTGNSSNMFTAAGYVLGSDGVYHSTDAVSSGSASSATNNAGNTNDDSRTGASNAIGNPAGNAATLGSMTEEMTTDAKVGAGRVDIPQAAADSISAPQASPYWTPESKLPIFAQYFDSPPDADGNPIVPDGGNDNQASMNSESPRDSERAFDLKYYTEGSASAGYHHVAISRNGTFVDLAYDINDAAANVTDRVAAIESGMYLDGYHPDRLPNVSGLTGAQQGELYSRLMFDTIADASLNPIYSEDSGSLTNLRSDAASAFARGDVMQFGLREPSDIDINQGRGAYDDQLVLLQKQPDGTVSVLYKGAFNADPAGSYRQDDQYFGVGRSSRSVDGVDANGDGTKDLGRLQEGVYEFTWGSAGHGSRNPFGSTIYTAPDGQQFNILKSMHPEPADRFFDGGWHFDSNSFLAHPDSSPYSAGFSMYEHTGYNNFTGSAGCQTFPVGQIGSMADVLSNAAIQTRQTSFFYVLRNLHN